MTKWTKAADGTWDADELVVFGVGAWQGGGPWEDPAWVAALAERSTRAAPDLQTPMVPGHPKRDATASEREAWLTSQPRLGIFESFRKAGEQIVARVRAIPQAVKDSIEAGLYGRLSVVIENSTKHGGPVISNVGLLGAATPAVPYAGFADAWQFTVAFTTTEGSESATDGSLASGEAQPGETPQETPPPSTVAGETRQPLPEAKEGTLADESKAGVEALAEKDRELVAMKAKLEEQEKVQAAFAEKVKREKIDGAFARLVEQGKATPAMKDSFVAVGMGLDDTKAVQFGEHKGTLLDGHIEAWEAREPMFKNTKPKSAGTPEGEKVEQSFDDKALAFADKFVADGKGTLIEGLATFEKEVGPDAVKEHRAQFAGRPDLDIREGATRMKGGK